MRVRRGRRAKLPGGGGVSWLRWGGNCCCWGGGGGVTDYADVLVLEEYGVVGLGEVSGLGLRRVGAGRTGMLRGGIWDVVVLGVEDALSVTMPYRA